jgi:hypothetical protein
MKSFNSPASLLLIPALLLAPILLNSCSILVGQVKPVEEKAPTAKLIGVDQMHPEWKSLALNSANPKATHPDDIPDLAWQSSKTAAVISLTSACRQNGDEDIGMSEFTSILLSQWRNLKIESQTDLVVSGRPALQTTAEGIYLNRHRKFQTVVVKTDSCIYDVLYLSPLKSFSQELAVFHDFRDSLKLK